VASTGPLLLFEKNTFKFKQKEIALAIRNHHLILIHCVSKTFTLFYFYDYSVKCWPIFSDVRYMSSPVHLSSVICLSSVTFVQSTQAIEIFGSVSTPFGTLATLWHPCKILRRSP